MMTALLFLFILWGYFVAADTSDYHSFSLWASIWHQGKIWVLTNLQLNF